MDSDNKNKNQINTSISVPDEMLGKIQASLSPIDEEFTDKHWQIIEAAVKVFSEKGFSASRTSDIAKEAGVSEGTIFNYFKSKKDLLKGLLIPMFASFFRPLMLAPIEKIFKKRANNSIEETLVELGQDRAQLLRKNMPLVRTIITESQYHPELLEPIRDQIAPKLFEAGKQYFQKEVDNGTFRNVDSFTAMRVYMSLIAGYVVMRNAFPTITSWEDDETEIRRMVDIYLHGVVNQATQQNESTNQ